MMRSDTWNPSIDISEKIIEKYIGGVSARQLGFEHNVADVTITGLLKRNNIKIKTHSKAIRDRYGYGLNENVFDEINEESAYWIGFILADGNVYRGSRNVNSINFGLKKSDWEHLEKLKKFFGCTKPIYYNKGLCFISFYSRKIQNKLAELGIVPRKSKIAKVPEILKNNRHFWRGMIDGDGWIHFNENNPGLSRIAICGTRDVVDGFKDFIKSNNKTYFKNNCYSIAQSGKYGSDVSKLIYDNSKIFLQRKLDLAKVYCWQFNLCINILG